MTTTRRILTNHVRSLPRPRHLLAASNGIGRNGCHRGEKGSLHAAGAALRGENKAIVGAGSVLQVC